jgi:UDP-N-acetylmuramoyl-tripeptide--D-alanyl-D-alanine ligase
MVTAIPQNRAPFTVDEIARATRGRVLRSGGATHGVCTDSRAVVEGSAFVALVGDKFDGHAFLDTAVAQGARTLIVSKDDVAATSAAVWVNDTRVALGDLGRAHRLRWAALDHQAGPRSLVAITGSAGKTTTKTALARVLSAASGGAVHATAGNLNNDVGVPMTLFGLEPEHRFAVVEVGTNARGEIENLAAISRPDVAILTLVAAAHTEGLGTVDDVAVEKGALLAALSPNGIAVVNGDDARAMAQLARSPARRTLAYGFGGGVDYRIVARDPLGLGGTALAIERAGSRIEVLSPLLGDAGALAVAASLAVVEALLARKLEGPELSAALAGLGAGGEGRLAPVALADGTLVIDDSYNANPASMRSSVRTAAEVARHDGRRLIVVLGEMRELGSVSGDEHADLGRFVAAHEDVDRVFAVGGDAQLVASEASAAGKLATFAADAEEAAHAVLGAVLAGDLVLVKGSRGVATEKVVRALVAQRGLAGAGGRS